MAHRVGLSKGKGTFGQHFLQILIVNHHTQFLKVLIYFILHATNRTLLRIFFFIQVSIPFSLLMSPEGRNAACGDIWRTHELKLFLICFLNISCSHTSYRVHITTYKHHKPHFFRHTKIIINQFNFYILSFVK